MLEIQRFDGLFSSLGRKSIEKLVSSFADDSTLENSSIPAAPVRSSSPLNNLIFDRRKKATFLFRTKFRLYPFLWNRELVKVEYRAWLEITNDTSPQGKAQKTKSSCENDPRHVCVILQPKCCALRARASIFRLSCTVIFDTWNAKTRTRSQEPNVLRSCAIWKENKS